MGSFPPSFERRYQGLEPPLRQGPQGYLSLKPSSEAIQGSIRTLLMTLPGERVMLPDYGSKLWYLVGEKNNAILANLAHTYTVGAIEQWEPRVRVLETQTTVEQNGFILTIVYEIKSITEIGRLTLPFTLV